MSRFNSKTSIVASVVNFVQSQVYHTEHPALFAACFCHDAAHRAALSVTADTCIHCKNTATTESGNIIYH